MTNDFEAWLSVPAEQAARRLVGCWLVREVEGEQLIGRIVETEAYDQHDAASHSYRGRTPRTNVMFGPPGHLYVYFTYGMHYCCNVVCGQPGQGAAVLIRALEPLKGLDSMSHRRRGRRDEQLTNGPAKLCQALAIDKTLNGHDLGLDPLRLVRQAPIDAADIIQTTRIGLSQAVEVPWRFYLKGNTFVSRPL